MRVLSQGDLEGPYWCNCILLTSVYEFSHLCFEIADNKNIFLIIVFFMDGEISILSICLAHFSRLDEAVSLIQLYHIVNPEAKSVNAHFEPGMEHSFIQVNLFLNYYSDVLMF